MTGIPAEELCEINYMTRVLKNKRETDMVVLVADHRWMCLFIIFVFYHYHYYYLYNYLSISVIFQLKKINVRNQNAFLNLYPTSASQYSQNSQCPVNALQPFLVESFLIDSTEANPISALSPCTHMWRLLNLNYFCSILCCQLLTHQTEWDHLNLLYVLF